MESQPFNPESGHDLEVENAEWGLNRNRTSPYGKEGKGKGNAHTQSGGTHPADTLLTSTLEELCVQHGQGKYRKGGKGKGNAHASGGTHPAGTLVTSTLEDIHGKGKHGQGKHGNDSAAA